MNHETRPARLLRKSAALLLCLAMLLTGIASAAAEGQDLPAAAETEGTEITLAYEAGWPNRSMAADTCRQLVNSQELHPQRTGWVQLDAKMAELISSCRGADTYSTLLNVYTWLVKNITYSWEGYSRQTAPAYNCFVMNYLSSMTYEEGLQKSVPDDMANRAMHILSARKGVCYDYAIAFALLARYMGLESYVRTGYFDFEAVSGSGHHGWAVLVLDGTEYIFDPQRDARNWQYNGVTGCYFGISAARAGCYHPNSASADVTANSQRNASMLSLTANRAHMVNITVNCTGSGTVEGAGKHVTGTECTLTALPEQEGSFVGWYDSLGNLLSVDNCYTFSVADDTVLEACFWPSVTLYASRSGSVSGFGVFEPGSQAEISAVSLTVPFAGWYLPDGTLYSTEAQLELTVYEPVTLIAMFEGDVYIDFTGSPETQWYEDAALEANSLGICSGITAITFGAGKSMTRGMAITMICRMDGADLSSIVSVPYSDVLPGELNYYYEPCGWAAEAGIITGVSEDTFRPYGTVTREQFAAMLTRYLQYLRYDLSCSDTVLPFTDADAITEYALEPVQILCQLGILQGYPNGTLCPQEAVSRAEGVAMLMRVYSCIRSGRLTSLSETQAADAVSVIPADDPDAGSPFADPETA